MHFLNDFLCDQRYDISLIRESIFTRFGHHLHQLLSPALIGTLLLQHVSFSGEYQLMLFVRISSSG